MSDTPRVKLATTPKARRSQAERTAETRARIMAAVIESIAEVGFQRTTANEIARRAGVTWGAVQHQFGGKDGILAAVLEDSFNHFAERLAGIPHEGTTLEERVAMFVDRAWEHFGGPRYRSTFEILLNYATAEGADAPESPWQAEMFQAWDRIWAELFADAKLPRKRKIALQLYTISLLSGMASLDILSGDQGRRHIELSLLKDTLVRELSGSGSP
jgi:AcrR family transcriptional regulator